MESWSRRLDSLALGALAFLILAWWDLQDQPRWWCLRAAPFMVGGVLFALRDQVAEVLRLLLA